MSIKYNFNCSDCNKEYIKWQGQCSTCNNWNTIVEKQLSIISASSEIKVYKLSSNFNEYLRIDSKISELNSVFGGGITMDSIALLGGPPGIGKSTLIMQLCANIANENFMCLYVSGEESLNQINMRGKRLGINNENILITTSPSIENITNIISSNDKIKFIILDSIQTINVSSQDSSYNSVSQIKNVTNILVNIAKNQNKTILLTGHVIKDGQIGGPKLLEHMVDTVLYFEEDKDNDYRIIRTFKNRFGNINEIGIFKMTENGLICVDNRSDLFISKKDYPTVGNVIFPLLEGNSILPVEIEALVCKNFTQSGVLQRKSNGWDNHRLSILLAVLKAKCNISFDEYDVYVNISGGLKIKEPGIDLAIVISIISARLNIKLNRIITFGEVSLSGDIKNIQKEEYRIKEMIKFGYKNIISPSQHISVQKVKNILEIIKIIK